jgi:(p)ppGpp synthase/HD superfamily hydrolase
MIGPLLAAARLAEDAHRDQRDKAGQPYIGHVIRVASNTAVVAKEHGWSEGMALVASVVAFLHDTVEDTWIELDDLRTFVASMFEGQAVRDAILEAVDAITHREGESWDDYLGRVEVNKLARVVKIADLTDNLDPLRELPDAAWQERARLKYRAALDRLTGGETSMAQLLDRINP